MAVTHIYSSRATEYGAKLHTALDQFDAGLRGLIEIAGTMDFMHDEAQATTEDKWAPLKPYFGFATGVAAKAAYDELMSLIAKLTTDASVTFVDAAIKQVRKKLA